MNQIEEFIYFFTHSKNLTQKQRAKRDELLARDVVKPKAKVPTATGVDSTGEEPSAQSKETSTTNHRLGVESSYFNPKGLKQFLLDFNQDEILRYTCHLIDTQEAIDQICEKTECFQYNFEKHVELIAENYKELKKKHNWPRYKIVFLINSYLTGELGGKLNRWSSNKIGDSWNDVNIRKWAKENPGIVPNPGKNIARKQKSNGYTLPDSFIAEHSGNRVYRFSDLVLFFKSLFHIRRDNSLRDIINHETKVHQDNYKDIKLSFEEDNFYDNIELFTDVDKLVQAFRKIINMCKANHKDEESQPIITLSFYNKEDETYFVVHHKNSKYGKSLTNALERIGVDQSGLIKSQINGLCDLFIEADFGQGEFARVNLWDAETEMKGTKTDMIKGVKYILRF